MLADKKVTFIDLFSGCGGFSEGLLQTNQFEALAHVEWELPMVKTLRKRLVDKWKHENDDAFKKVIHFDIQKTKELLKGKWSKESVIKYGKTNDELVIKNGLKGIVGRKKVDVIIGGPPCQAYSIAGRAQDKNSMKDDYRNYLFEGFVEVVKTFKPKIFVFENVPGILSACPGGDFVTERIFSAFENIGYEIKKGNDLKKYTFLATDFGVPQSRRRVIIFGVQKKSKLKLEDIYNALDSLKSKGKNLTVKSAIGNLPKFFPLAETQKAKRKNISHSSISDKLLNFHIPRYHNKRDINLFRKWIDSGMNQKSNFEKICFYNKLMDKKSKHAKYRNLEWDKPSPTIVAHLSKDGLMFIHPDPEQARSITIHEASLLQSFPKDYEFVGSNAYCYKMIGNAVPPKMAMKIGYSILNILRSKTL